MTRDIILIDIDHVICDASPRDPMIGVTTWDEYHEASVNDQPATDIIEFIEAIGQSNKYAVWGITARPEKWRQMTNRYLAEHGVWFDNLLMRPDDAYHPADEIKIALVRKHLGEDWAQRVLFILDDNEKVINAFKAAGVTALQVFGRRYYK